MRIEFHPETEGELNDAVSYYNGLRSGLGEALKMEIYAVIERIAEHPDRFRVVEEEIRRCLVHRFPYTVLYRIAGKDVVRIVSIRHHRRDPAVGMQRR